MDLYALRCVHVSQPQVCELILCTYILIFVREKIDKIDKFSVIYLSLNTYTKTMYVVMYV